MDLGEMRSEEIDNLERRDEPVRLGDVYMMVGMLWWQCNGGNVMVAI